MRIFLSHIHEEATLASTIKDWIESTFAGQIEVFVSSDIQDLPAGSKWLQTISTSISESSAFIVLCSDRSISRPWINFETGCAWITNVPVLPLCHSGATKATLPPPLSEFQALDILDSSFCPDLFHSIARHLSIKKIPRIDQNQMQQELQTAIDNIDDIESPNTTKPFSQSAKLDSEAIKIISFLANNPEGGNPSAEEIAEAINIHITKCKYHLDNLEELKFVHPLHYVGRPADYYLTTEGRKYAVENDLLR